jgi:fido (protein-threonine AMPylation protein)
MKHKNKRSSLEGAFEGLDIYREASTSQTTNFHLGRSVRQMMKATMLPGASIRARSARGLKATFTIAMDEAYDYNILGDIDPDILFKELKAYASDIVDAMKSLTPVEDAVIDEHLVDVLARIVFGSNMIEAAGSGRDVTLELCEKIFRGEEVPEEIEERDSEYAALKANLLRKNLPGDIEAVLRSRREIIQHAKAASYIINEIYLCGKNLSENIILETHRILTHKVDSGDLSWTQYSGIYRNIEVCAGLQQFTDPCLVPYAMQGMIKELEEDLECAVQKGEIDPVAFAAKYCHKFVNIHPFVDGNGRTCRLILNALLLKYCGVLVCIGESGDDREKYMAIACTASFKEANQQDDEPEETPKFYKELATYTLKQARDSMHRLFDTLKEKRKVKGFT